MAAEKTFNKLTVKGKKLSIRWGKSQGKQETITASPVLALPHVPGLPGALPAPPEELRNNFFNLGEAGASAATAPAVPFFVPTAAALPALAGPGAIHYPSQDPSRMGATQRQIQP